MTNLNYNQAVRSVASRYLKKGKSSDSSYRLSDMENRSAQYIVNECDSKNIDFLGCRYWNQKTL